MVGVPVADRSYEQAKCRMVFSLTYEYNKINHAEHRLAILRAGENG